jgi:hypothetical protein
VTVAYNPFSIRSTTLTLISDSVTISDVVFGVIKFHIVVSQKKLSWSIFRPGGIQANHENLGNSRDRSGFRYVTSRSHDKVG